MIPPAISLFKEKHSCLWAFSLCYNHYTQEPQKLQAIKKKKGGLLTPPYIIILLNP